MMRAKNCASFYPHGGTLGFARLSKDGSLVVSRMRSVILVADITGTICSHIVRTSVRFKSGLRFKTIWPVPILGVQNYQKP